VSTPTFHAFLSAPGTALRFLAGSAFSNAFVFSTLLQSCFFAFSVVGNLII
jgi:hypothetical protein